ncbi:glycosyltransferase family 2 protein [Adhaeretor mobilis]|uniref:Undecaprenyl-phosphate 4-deoxy-4-formamido-L-arabinose transferase n=1 Tax=Adhaeretor mobilis TaxID=1930276 RepID=A0A517MSQ4_9BACT|nr:glycosyltransferase family 2 protein [Adhaeretor mobilis]QDS97913.1 Undecaprenyl-phosphate 4-deoxy-4-formamido-L-arabinose transferase [Adhaeretor mobilis]
MSELPPTVATATKPAPATTDSNAAILARLNAADRAIRECLDTIETSEPNSPAKATSQLELTVVMPCLNEADTLAVCIEKAQRAMREHDIDGEVVIADNGSTDGSLEIAEQLGARVVHIAEKGYGNALRGGISSALGKYVIMGDADDSYDFLEIPKFVDKLREGHDLVQGCRLPTGGGTVLPGAMPVTHRWIGNPMFSRLVRRMFKAPIHDVYCGLRGFTKEHYDRLDLRASGMEFATEMIIKSSLFKTDIAEVPTTLHPDGRKAHAPHLRTVRDGWRTLRFFLMYSPRWLFLTPGLGLVLLGFLGYSLAIPGVEVFGATLDAHTLLVSSLFVLTGFQLVQFAAFAKTFAVSEGLVPFDRRLERICEVLSLERCLVAGSIAAITGIGLIAAATSSWQAAGFGALDYASTMRWVIPGVTLAALGFQTIFASFFISILRMARRN